jgi:hypothetical protein
MDSTEMTDEEVAAWYEEKRRQHEAHLATLSPETIALAEACIARARNADRSTKKLAVPREEYDAYETYLEPWIRFQDTKLARAGVQNILCRAIPIYVEEN